MGDSHCDRTERGDFGKSWPYTTGERVATLTVAKRDKLIGEFHIRVVEDGSATMEVVLMKKKFKNGTSRLADLPMKKIADSSPLCEAEPSE